MHPRCSGCTCSTSSFFDLGFAGNVNNYYDPENSYLNAVLRTRRGILISLAVLWMELAQGWACMCAGWGFRGTSW